MARVGLLGGTFNPPHLGHLVCAQEARVQLGLDRVLLIPTRVPPHKVVEVEPGVEHRVAMCEAAVATDPSSPSHSSTCGVTARRTRSIR